MEALVPQLLNPPGLDWTRFLTRCFDFNEYDAAAPQAYPVWHSCDSGAD